MCGRAPVIQLGFKLGFFMMEERDTSTLAVIGLGYVGLPLAVEFGKKRAVIGFDIDAGRIEAVDTTFWFGFKDDVVIRIIEREGSARIDVRSKSRVGVGDVGTNARRVRTLLSRMQPSSS